MSVALLKYNKDAVKKAVEMVGGFEKLKANHRVLIKPNVVIGGSRSQLPNGIVTTVPVMRDIITVLREFGCSDIVIGEGGMVLKEIGMTTSRGYAWSGLKALAEELDIPLIDLNEDAFDTINIDGDKIGIAKTVMEADFVINVPVLKTHQLTRVSLGMKNLKGCLNDPGKKKFHQGNLERYIAILNQHIKSSLTIIDGVYGLHKGPIGENFQNMGLIIAGKDVFEVDTVGSTILGFNPQEIIHMQVYAALENRNLSLRSVEVLGENVNDLKGSFEWQAEWPQDILNSHKITGINFQTPFYTTCSPCAMAVSLGVGNYFKENQGKEFERVQICQGRESVIVPGMEKIVLLGKCAEETHGDIPGAIKVKGCPPSIKNIYAALKDNLG